MEQQRRTESKEYLAAVFLCALVPVVLYQICLFLSTDSYSELNTYGPWGYLFKNIIYGLMGTGFGWFFRKSSWVGRKLGEVEQEETDDTECGFSYHAMRQHEKRSRRRRLQRTAYLLLAVLFLLAAVFIVFLVSEWHLPFAAWKLREAMYCIWPLLLLCLFQAVWDLWDQRVEHYIFGVTETCKAVVYFCLAGILIWLMQDVMARYYNFTYEPVRTGYLILMAVVVLLISRGRLRSRRNQAGILLTVLGATAGICWCFFRNHYRVREILYNLGVEAARGEYFFNNENWLTYHIRALIGNLNGDISMLRRDFLEYFSYTNPVAFMNYVGGGLLAMVVLAWLVLWLVMLFRLYSRVDAPHFYRKLLLAVAVSMALKLILGVAADALLVTSSGVAVPLLGNSTDVMLLTALPYLINYKGEKQHEL